MIKDNGDGSYDVTLYAKGDKVALIPTVVTIKRQFPIKANGNPAYAQIGDNEMWVMIMEKAYAKLKGDYDAIVGGDPADVMSAITGEAKTSLSTALCSETQILEFLQRNLLLNTPMTASSHPGKDRFQSSTGSEVVKNHAYTIISVANGQVSLRNPWGSTDAIVTIKEFKEFFYRVSF